MHTQYFVTGVISRRQAAARVSEARSKLRARRNDSAVAASTSSARSASTPAMIGKLVEGASEHLALAAMVERLGDGAAHQGGGGDRAVEPGMRHHLDDGRDAAAFLADQAGRARPSNSTSLEAFERLPSLSFRRWKWSALTVSSGRKRGTRKHDRPPGRLREDEEAVAHRRGHEPLVAGDAVGAPLPSPSGSARVVLARTSVPPWRSVIPMPMVAADFLASGRKRWSY